MKKIILKIDGMSCSACQNRLEKYLNQKENVKANINLVLAQGIIEFDEEKYTIEDIEQWIKEAGYQSLGIYDNKEEKKKEINPKTKFILFGILLLGIMILSMFHYKKTMILILIGIIPYLIFGFDILKNGIKFLIKKTPNMDSLVTIGVLSSLIYSLIQFLLGNEKQLYFESCAMIIYFVKLGRQIEHHSKEKTKSVIQELVQITPKNAIIKKRGKEIEVTIDEIKKKDIVICRPGEKIAVDGMITEGSSHIDEAFITGESIKAKKKVGDSIKAGSINIDGYIEYEALKIGPESTISEIVRLIMESSATKAPIGKLADKLSGYFVPGVMITALLSLIGHLVITHSFSESLLSFITVLVVSCPCALGLATPIAIFVAEGSCAKDGILIKESEILENAHKVNTIVFDKTGTITYGMLKISKIINESKYSNQEILEIIASIEKNSLHPIATAFKPYQNQKIKSEKYSELSGIGVCAKVKDKKFYIGNNKILKKLEVYNKYLTLEEELTKEGNTMIYFIEEKKVIALIGLKDMIRENTKSVIQKLNSNYDIIMLTGDNKNTAERIGKEVEIKNIYANVLPQEKEEKIEKLKKEGKKIMMVGDGINDAPALVKSDIGVSMKNGTDIAGNSADVILIHNDLESIPKLINYSKKTVQIISQNLFWAFIYNIAMIPIAIGILKPIGISITPSLAAICMTLSNIIVITNSLRL